MQSRPAPRLRHIQGPADPSGRGKGKIALRAAAFTELNTHVPLLDPGRVIEQTLRPRQQASFWVRVSTPGLVVMRVAGRTAGALEVWRDGRWRTNVNANHGEVTPSPFLNPSTSGGSSHGSRPATIW